MDKLPIEQLHFDGYLTMNGQLMLDEKKEVMFGVPITGQAKDLLLNLFESNALPVLLLEQDRIYLNRMAAVFGGKYADKCEMHGFTDLEEAMAALERSGIDVLLANANFDIDVNAIPKRCGFA
jgi:hypothetical protein